MYGGYSFVRIAIRMETPFLRVPALDRLIRCGGDAERNDRLTPNPSEWWTCPTQVTRSAAAMLLSSGASQDTGDRVRVTPSVGRSRPGRININIYYHNQASIHKVYQSADNVS